MSEYGLQNVVVLVDGTLSSKMLEMKLDLIHFLTRLRKSRSHVDLRIFVGGSSAVSTDEVLFDLEPIREDPDATIVEIEESDSVQTAAVRIKTYALRLAEKFDHFIIFSQHDEYSELTATLQEQGKRVSMISLAEKDDSATIDGSIGTADHYVSLRSLANAKTANDSSRIAELDRLGAVYSLDILDTEYEQSYDALTERCAEAFGMPIAAISLIGEKRQWFKSVLGLNFREVNRASAICDLTIRSSEPLIIADTRDDPRTAGKSLIKSSQSIRFYAGVPLVLSGGQRVGTFCLMDKKPRRFDERETAMLKEVAKTVVRKLELRSEIRHLDWALSRSAVAA